MKKIIIKSNKEESNTFSEGNNFFSAFNIYSKIFPLIIINIIIFLYLIIENILIGKEIKELIIFKDLLLQNNNHITYSKNYSSLEINDFKLKKKDWLGNEIFIDNKLEIDMIGLKYPEINFEKIKSYIMNNKIKLSLIQFLKELEIKLIYLEKGINVTKVNTFYTSRTLLLKQRNIQYDDSNITEFNHIISWLVIHRSTQLKGIVSDKYLACKYVKMKLGIDLCPQRIGVYNSVEEIDFKKIIKMGNVILKISNGNNDNTYIFNNTDYDIKQLKKKVEKSFYRNFPFIDKVFSH